MVLVVGIDMPGIWLLPSAVDPTSVHSLPAPGSDCLGLPVGCSLCTRLASLTVHPCDINSISITSLHRKTAMTRKELGVFCTS